MGDPKNGRQDQSHLTADTPFPTPVHRDTADTPIPPDTPRPSIPELSRLTVKFPPATSAFLRVSTISYVESTYMRNLRYRNGHICVQPAWSYWNSAFDLMALSWENKAS